MPKVATIQTNFSGGELSPFLYGRPDIAKYNSGAARVENFHPIVQGGARSRDGSMRIGKAKGPAYLVPFVFDRANAWQIELGTSLGAGYLRIWRADRGAVETSPGAPLELATPFSAVILSELTYEQADDTMFFFHSSIAPTRLVRHSATAWAFEAVPFVTAPFGEIGYSPGVALTLSAATVGTGRTATAAAPVFLAGDVGRDLISTDGGRSTITAVTDSTHATISIAYPFASTTQADYTLSDSPMAFLAADRKSPVGGAAVLFGALPRTGIITLSAKTGGSITISSAGGIFNASDTGKRLFTTDGGVAGLVYVNDNQLTGQVTTDFQALTYQTGDFAIDGAVWRASDVGRFVSFNGGLYKITGYTSSSLLSAEIMVSPSALTAAPPGSWTLGGNEFSASRGYPACGTLGEQRLWLGGSRALPTQVWASAIGAYLDFAPGLGDADGFTYALVSHQRNPMRHMAFGKRLFALTSGHQVSLRGGNEKAIGATNIQKEDAGQDGANFVRPVVIGNELLFVQGAGRKVRAMGFDTAQDGYVAPDRTVFSEHVTVSGITDMAYQAEPFPLLYAVRADGQMAVCAYDVSQEVIAWSRFTTEGYYRSVSTVPRPTRDDVWTIVDRPDGNGASRYFIEVFDPLLATDCAGFFNVGDGGVGVSYIAGLDDFEGLALAVRADDVNFGPLTVTSGRITLPRPALRYIEAGLPFVPTLELLPIEIGGGSTTQGSTVTVHEVVVRVLATRSIEVNGHLVDFRRFGSALLDQPPPSFTGDYSEVTLTDDTYTRGTITIRQPLPMPAHIQCVIRKATVNDL